MRTEPLHKLLSRISACRECESSLPMGPRPVVRAAPESRILLVSQAPGRRVHDTGIPWNDPSGDRLRSWLGVDKKRFYDSGNFAIMPMGFCYPGTGKSGDLPPRKECAPLWHQSLLEHLRSVQLTIYVGAYAQKYYLGNKSQSLTATVAQWRTYAPAQLPLPHPSPRNKVWFQKNPWFEEEVVPYLKKSVEGLIG